LSNESDGVRAFWRDDAKLFWLRPEERVKVWIALLGTAIACTLLVVFGDHVGVNQIYARLFIVVAGVFVFPLSLAIEMYFKGGKAGRELKAGFSTAHWRRAELGDVKERLTDLFMTCPHGDADQEFSAFMDWFTKTLMTLREMLRSYKSDQFYGIAQVYIGGPFSNTLNRTPSAFSTCHQWLNRARYEVTADDINPEFQIKCRH